MKKLVKESLNEWNSFKTTQWNLSRNNAEPDPFEEEYKIGQELVSLFNEIGFKAAISSLGANHIGIQCENSNFMFYVEDDNIYYEGIEFTDELEAAEFIGNLNNPEELKAELEKILV